MPPCTPDDPLACLIAAVDPIGASGGFNGQIVVAHEGSILWEGVYGRDEAGNPMTAQTKLGLASAGKMFTGVAIGQLVEAGDMRFDDEIGTYVSGLPADVAAVPLSSLLSHTAGLLMNDWRPGLVHPPGEFHYSNAGFALVEMALEEASGQSIVAYQREHILEPAGMSDTRFDEPGTTATDPDGSTASDIVKFAEALLADRLVSADIRREITSLKVETEFGGYAYGFAVLTGTAGEARSIGHIGAVPAVIAAVEINPRLGYTVVVLCVDGFDAIAPALVEYQKKIGMGYWRG